MPRGRGLAAVAAAALLVGISGCQLNDSGDNVVAGKQDFVAKCGSCHTLKRAGTTGVTGPNLDLLRQVCEITDKPVVASGGVSSLDDLRAIASLTGVGVEGAIVGKALYAGAFTLPEALAAVAGL